MLGNLGVSSLCPEKCLGLQNVQNLRIAPPTRSPPGNVNRASKKEVQMCCMLLRFKQTPHLQPTKAIWVFPKIVGFPPKTSILIRFSIINHPFWGTRIFGNIHLSEIEPQKKTAMTTTWIDPKKIFSQASLPGANLWFALVSLHKIRDEYFPLFFGAKKNLGHWMPGDNPPGAQGLPGLLVGLNVGATSRCNTTCHQEGNDCETPVKWCLKWWWESSQRHLMLIMLIGTE